MFLPAGAGGHVGWATRAAVAWCVGFALLHLFWAVGGSIGLASSAGRHLADQRPISFVVFGLYGVAATLFGGSAVLIATSRAQASRLRTAAIVVLFLAGVALTLRGVGLEVVIGANVGGVRAQIGPLETRWSLLLWNPFFVVGGALFVASSVQAHHHRDKGQSR